MSDYANASPVHVDESAAARIINVHCRCPVCGKEITRVLFTAYEGLWRVRPNTHASIVGGIACEGSDTVIKQGRIK